MPRITVDATEAQTFEAIPEDTYPAEIRDITGPHQGPKAQYMKFEFEINDGEYVGRRLWQNYTIEGKGAGFFCDLVNKIMGEGTAVVGEPFDFDTDDLLGSEVQLVVEVGEYQGEPSNEIKKVLVSQ